MIAILDALYAAPRAIRLALSPLWLLLMLLFGMEFLAAMLWLGMTDYMKRGAA